VRFERKRKEKEKRKKEKGRRVNRFGNLLLNDNLTQKVV
jgi:hypothetical protein